MKKYAGIDIGGTQLRLGIFDEAGKLLDVYKTVNDRTLGGEKNIDLLLEYVFKNGHDVSAYGIASPGPLDLKRGMILNPPNLYGWDNFPIVRYIREKTGKPCAVNNDGKLFAHRDSGLANEVFNEMVLTYLQGSYALGHVRYSAAGDE